MDLQDIRSLCPKLQKFVEEISHSRLGISPEPVRIRNLNSSKHSAALCSKRCVNDRFSLVIPYCDKHLVWDVIFLCDRPELPPDFHFGEINFLVNADCKLLEEKVPSLANWDYNDPKALLKVISEFLVLFKFYQLRLIPDHHRAFSEIGMLLDSDGNIADITDVEIVRQTEGIHALICVLPESLREANDNFKIVLSLNFEMRYDRVRSGFKSFGEHKFWDTSNNSELPTFYDDKNFLMDYIPEIKKRIETIVTQKLRTIAKRKQLIFQFCVTFKSSLIEFDAVNFLFVVFSLSRDNLQFFVRIDLPKTFPRDSPSYKLISNYCYKELMNNNLDKIEFPINNVRYTSDMSMVEVVQNFFSKYYEVFNNFKRTSVSLMEKNLNSLKM